MLDSLTKAPLKPYQRLEILRTFLIRKLKFELVLGSAHRNTLRRIDRLVRDKVRMWLRLREDTTLAFMHSKIDGHGLGIPCLETTIPLEQRSKCERLVNSGTTEVANIVQCKAVVSDLVVANAPISVYGIMVNSKSEEDKAWREALIKTHDCVDLANVQVDKGGFYWLRNPRHVFPRSFIRRLQLHGGLLTTKPDLVVRSGSSILVMDVTIVSSKRLAECWHLKVSKYDNPATNAMIASVCTENNSESYAVEHTSVVLSDMDPQQNISPSVDLVPDLTPLFPYNLPVGNAELSELNTPCLSPSSSPNIHQLPILPHQNTSLNSSVIPAERRTHRHNKAATRTTHSKLPSLAASNRLGGKTSQRTLTSMWGSRQCLPVYTSTRQPFVEHLGITTADDRAVQSQQQQLQQSDASITTNAPLDTASTCEAVLPHPPTPQAITADDSLSLAPFLALDDNCFHLPSDSPNRPSWLFDDTYVELLQAARVQIRDCPPTDPLSDLNDPLRNSNLTNLDGFYKKRRYSRRVSFRNSKQLRRIQFGHIQNLYRRSRKDAASTILDGRWRNAYLENDFQFSDFNNYWLNILRGQHIIDTRPSRTLLPREDRLAAPITPADVTRALSNMDGSATGPDRLTLNDIRNYRPASLCALFNSFLLSEGGEFTGHVFQRDVFQGGPATLGKWSVSQPLIAAFHTVNTTTRLGESNLTAELRKAAVIFQADFSEKISPLILLAGSAYLWTPGCQTLICNSVAYRTRCECVIDRCKGVRNK
ncbi:uncharacterized protein DEA37_0002514 [Paragonimus westermani]|uniref:Uncharacterized protein n=1 Tax=Paragonimus westermani TaxID=34504 RepID=A0A5J4NCQ8_9TREM|nr:uncharacterized protein DEA37_0002514 [Paragonimus westermani]